MVTCLAEACEVVLRDPMNKNDVNFLERLLKDHHRLSAQILFWSVFSKHKLSDGPSLT